MGYDRQSVALIASCILAVVVAGAFFPAAGYGDLPDRDAVDEEYYRSGSTAGPGDAVGDGTGADPGGGNDAGEDETNDTDQNETDERNETNESNETNATDVDENATADDGGSHAGGTAGESLVGLLAWFGTFAALVALLWRVTDPTRSSDVEADDLPDGFFPRFRLRLRRIPQLTMTLTIGASRAVPSVVDAVSQIARGVGVGLGAVARDVGRGSVAAVVALPSALAVAVGSIGRGLSASSGLASAVGSLRGRRRRRRRSVRGDSADATTEEEETDPETVEEAWERMVSLVPVRARRARTPGEYARAAVEHGLPSRPVSRLTRAFREVRYGGYPSGPDRTRRARDAYERIERAARDEGGERE